MRTSRLLLAAALALIPLIAHAQAAPGPPPAATGWTGAIDFGVRGTSADGDAARYERYRDLGDGLFAETVRLARERNGWFLDIAADHVGRKDQRYRVDLNRPGTIKTWFLWDQIPMLLSRTTRTLFTGVGSGVLEIDNALQAQVQANPAAIAPIFSQFGTEFETRTRRRICRVEGDSRSL